MKSSRVGMVVTLVAILVLESDGRLLENDLLMGPWAFHPELNGMAERGWNASMLTFKMEEHPRPKGIAHRLAKSEHSPGVGHMQVFHTAKSRQRDKKRILQSTPSPGGGH